MTYRAWRSARDWVFLADVTEDLRRHVVSRWITTFVRTGSTWRRSYAEHRVGLFSRSSVLRELRARFCRPHVAWLRRRTPGASPIRLSCSWPAIESLAVGRVTLPARNQVASEPGGDAGVFISHPERQGR